MMNAIGAQAEGDGGHVVEGAAARMFLRKRKEFSQSLSTNPCEAPNSYSPKKRRINTPVDKSANSPPRSPQA